MIAHSDKPLGDRRWVFFLSQMLQLESIKLSLKTEDIINERTVMEIDWRMSTTTHVQYRYPAQVALTP